MSLSISRDQVQRVLRDASWTFKDQTKRVEIYGKAGCIYRVVVPKRDLFTDTQVKIILSQAKFPGDEIERFLRDAVKS